MIEIKGKKIHFVGIKGTGVAALVEILFHKGAIISGSDVSERFYTDEILEKLGIKALPFSKDNITSDIDFIVYSSAYNFETNPDLKAAKEKNIKCYLYTEFLGLISETSFSVGICGVHGKTTTTGITGTVIASLPLSAQILAGSVIKSFSDFCTLTTEEAKKDGNNKYFIAETCEYQRHFMSFCPKIIVLTSVESDHQDYYPTFKDIQNAFVDYILKLPEGGKLIYCADDEGAAKTAKIAKSKRKDIVLIPYGERAEETLKEIPKQVRDDKSVQGDILPTQGDILPTQGGLSCRTCFGISSIHSQNGTQAFNILNFGTFQIKIPGHHTILDATAAVAVATCLLEEEGLNPDDFKNEIKQGLLNFKGAKRRSEIVAETKNKNGDSIIFIDDYGHHPTAVKTTLSGYKDFYKNRKIIVDFMSHTYTRSMALKDEFSKCFDSSDVQIIHKIYGSAREKVENPEKLSEDFFNCIKKHNKNAVYYEEILDAVDFAVEKLNEKNENGYLFITMGAGNNWIISSEILKKIGG